MHEIMEATLRSLRLGARRALAQEHLVTLPVERGQRLGSPALFLRGARVRDGEREVLGDQAEKSPVIVVEGPMGADAEHQESVHVARPHPRHRQHQAGLRNVAPEAHRQRVEARAEVVHLRSATRARRLRERPGGGVALRLRQLHGQR